MRALAAGVVAAVAAAAGTVPAAHAAFSGTATASQSVATLVLADPIDVAAAETACHPRDGSEVTVSWTAGDAEGNGHEISRSDDGGQTFASMGAVPTGVTAYVDDTVAAATTYVYAVATTRSAWRSPGGASEAVTTSGPRCGGGNGGGTGGGKGGGRP